jgi:hypothetical protein
MRKWKKRAPLLERLRGELGKLRSEKPPELTHAPPTKPLSAPPKRKAPAEEEAVAPTDAISDLKAASKKLTQDIVLETERRTEEALKELPRVVQDALGAVERVVKATTPTEEDIKRIVMECLQLSVANALRKGKPERKRASRGASKGRRGRRGKLPSTERVGVRSVSSATAAKKKRG